jgi:RNA polymerase sigma factor (sigma-70 family)
MAEGSVTGWLAQLQGGDPAAAQKLWERYFRRLVGLARKKLEGSDRRVADEEDVALSAFHTFCRNAQQGRFPDLGDRDSLWSLLVTITARKAAHLVRDQQRLKRTGTPADPEVVSLDAVVGREPTPEFAAQVADEFQKLLQKLNDAELASIALWKMEGYSVEEIAGKLGYAPRSIKRKLHLIRELWKKESGS